MIVAVVVALAVLVFAFGGVSVYAYAQFGPVSAKCPPTEGVLTDTQEPTSFTARYVDPKTKAVHEIASAQYGMPAPVDVTFPARGQPEVRIAAWWEPVAAADAPTVVLLHGRNGCRRNSGNLLVAGMLHRHGIAVLLIDMRNHGDSTVEGGQFAGGSDEYRDALGAFDWLTGQGVPRDRIGLLGFSGGAVSALIAAGEEPAIRAVWADTAFPDLATVIGDGIRQLPIPIPGPIGLGAVTVARLYAGHDVTTLTPIKAMPKLADRSVYLTQGTADTYLDPRYVDVLADAARAAGGAPTVWRVEAADHTMAHFLHPADYEARVTTFFATALAG